MTRLKGGQWLLFEHVDPIGYERWTMTTGENGSRLLESEGGATFPQPHETRVRVEVDVDGRVRALTIETLVEGEGRPRRLQGSVTAEDVLLVTRDVEGAPPEELVPIGGKGHLDFPSPLLTAVMLRRLALAPGEAREFSAVLVSLLTFELSRQAYGFERLEDERVKVPAGEFDARVYRYASAATGFTGRVWSDEEDNVIKYEGSWELVTAEGADEPPQDV